MKDYLDSLQRDKCFLQIFRISLLLTVNDMIMYLIDGKIIYLGPDPLLP